MCCPQVKVTVAEEAKWTDPVRKHFRNGQVILVDQELDYVLTGDKARHASEMIRAEVWDVHLCRQFQVITCSELALSQDKATEHSCHDWIPMVACTCLPSSIPVCTIFS